MVKIEEFSYTCMNCGEAFTSPVEIKNIAKQLCPYCFTVHCGEPDEKWPPTIGGREFQTLRKRRGVQVKKSE